MRKNSKKHCIYAFEFEELGVAYVGLTKGLKARKAAHLNPNIKGNRRLKALFAAGERYMFRVLQEGITREEAAGREDHWYNCYKINGYEMLNVAKPGALGAPEDGIYWIQEKCKEDAALYKTKSDWQRAKGSAYKSALTNGWLIECCAHMTVMFKWTLEACKASALEYENKKEWRAAPKKGYNEAARNDWLEECCAHMPGPKWTLEVCKADALKYNTRNDWQKAPKSGYKSAARHGWIEECCDHMNHGALKWTLDTCKADALKYERRKKWQKAPKSGYDAAQQKGWLEECCAHMIDGNLALIKWTLEACKADALEYETKVEWIKTPKSGYSAAAKNGWIEECCAHMVNGYVGPKKWPLEACKADALKYNTKIEWLKAPKSGYQAAVRNDWIEECCDHMTVLQINWTIEACKSDALKHETRTEWQKAPKSGYQAAVRNDWIEECCAHMTVLKINWTIETCKADALEYNTKIEWQKAPKSGYQSALKNGWVEECCAHMIDGRIGPNKWTLEACKADALKHETKSKWRNTPKSGYNAAYRNGWLKECCGHMAIHKQITSKDSASLSVRPLTKAA